MEDSLSLTVLTNSTAYILFAKIVFSARMIEFLHVIQLNFERLDY